MSESWPREPQGRELEKLTQLFKALGDSSRMKVLFQIGSSEACVSEVARQAEYVRVRCFTPSPYFTHERSGPLA